jgi:site-specific DNA recombinase
MKRLEEQHRRLGSKLDVLYDDRLEGRISPEMYDRKALECRNQATALERRIEEIRAAAPAPAESAIDLMGLTSRAAELFLVQPPHEKQAFLRLVLKSAAWRHGELQAQFEEPFENLRRSNQLSRRKDVGIGEGPTQNGIWLPGMDSNHDKANARRICNLQIPQRPRMPQWSRKTTTRTQLVHGFPCEYLLSPTPLEPHV